VTSPGSTKSPQAPYFVKTRATPAGPKGLSWLQKSAIGCRMSRNARSIVAELIASNLARTLRRQLDTARRSIASTRIGSSGRSRLPQIRSDASQPHQRLAHSLIANPAAGPRSATPVHLSSRQQTHRMLAVIAGLQRPSGASSQWTRRWRGMDSNLRYRAATGAGSQQTPRWREMDSNF
jgi:hypothetical protein